MLMVDIDYFKNVNDNFGHDVGDKIILLVANTLQKTFRQVDLVGRFGGDEFLIYIQDLPSIAWLESKIAKIIYCENNELHCLNSVGITLYPDDGTDFESLFKRVDEALYVAKHRVEKYHYYQYKSK